MAKRLTTQDFSFKIDAKHGKGEFTVLGEYVNGKTPVSVRHNSIHCNYYVWNVVPENILYNGSGCPICRKRVNRHENKIKAILGESKVNVSDFVNLQVGDIIRLDTSETDEMDVYVGNIKKFKAMPGKNGENYAVRVTSVMREEE